MLNQLRVLEHSARQGGWRYRLRAWELALIRRRVQKLMMPR